MTCAIKEFTCLWVLNLDILTGTGTDPILRFAEKHTNVNGTFLCKMEVFEFRTHLSHSCDIPSGIFQPEILIL